MDVRGAGVGQLRAGDIPDETTLRMLAELLLGELAPLVPDPVAAAAIEAALAEALNLPDGDARRALRRALSSEPVIRAWVCAQLERGNIRDRLLAAAGDRAVPARFLTVTCPTQVEAGGDVPVEVWITERARDRSASCQPFVVPSSGIELVVVVAAGPGSRVVGPAMHPVRVPERGDSELVLFVLGTDPDVAGTASRMVTAEVHAYVAGRPAGDMSLAVESGIRHRRYPGQMGRHVTDPPVFVIHAIADHDPAEFDQRVRKLADDTGRTDVHPVYWGDLGAGHQWVPKIVPAVSRRLGRPPRDDAGRLEATDLDELAVAMVAEQPGTCDRVEWVLAGVRDELGTSLPGLTPPAGGRDSRTGNDELNSWVLAAVGDAWLDPAFGWLCSISDPDLLAELGAAVARTTVDLVASGPAEDPGPVRSPDQVRRVVGAVLRQADWVAAATVGTAAAQFVSWARVRAAPAVAMNVGDVLGYHRHRREILDRVWATIADRVGPGAGRDGTRPVHLVGHGLGAVIALDAAAAAVDPVHTASIVTFGSHWSLLHLWRPDGTVPRFDGQPVSLPPTIRRWTNLWERLDLLAFLAEPLFVLPDGTHPRDVELRQGYAGTLFSHSVYWDSPLALAELAQAWRNDDR